MFFFKTRGIARAFASKNDVYKFVDMGKGSSKRWAVKVVSE